MATKKKIEPTDPNATKTTAAMGEHDAERVTGRKVARTMHRKAYKKSV